MLIDILVSAKARPPRQLFVRSDSTPGIVRSALATAVAFYGHSRILLESVGSHELAQLPGLDSMQQLEVAADSATNRWPGQPEGGTWWPLLLAGPSSPSAAARTLSHPQG